MIMATQKAYLDSYIKVVFEKKDTYHQYCWKHNLIITTNIMAYYFLLLSSSHRNIFNLLNNRIKLQLYTSRC